MDLSMYTNLFDIKYTESGANASSLYERHCHFRFELIAVMCGSIEIVIEGHTYKCKTGDMAVIPPLTYHSVSVGDRSEYKRITALFDSSVLPHEISQKLIENVKISPIFSPNPLSYLCDRLHKSLEKQNSASYAPLADAIVLQILYTCADEVITEKIIGDSHSTDILEKAIRYIDEHITEKLSLESIAQSLFISRSSLSHIFSEKMQISPKQYIIQKKVAYANMLIENGTSMTQAAHAIGYDNYSNFYRMYRKINTKGE